MTVQMRKFGKLLNSRPAGREAALRVFQIANGFIEDKEIILDFSGVEVLTPSFADELIQMLQDKYKEEKIIRTTNIETTTIKDTLASIGFEVK